ncbi:MAG: hypothetical protein QM572_05205 [Nocardioides sp.]|uniref:hypothetical protein n=1 Tax=Nocardioides sp. TaxID=35761 RepID=UPI0039E274B8
MSLPEGAALRLRTDGGIDVIGSDGVSLLGDIEAPWATDATGQPVPTSFELVDGQIVQSVLASEDTQYPVVADPTYNDCGLFTCTKYLTKADTEKLYDKLADHSGQSSSVVSGIFAAACLSLGGISATLCGLAGNLYANGILDNLRAAHNHKQCFTLTYTRYPEVILHAGHSSNSTYCKAK